jgi:CubicO group peptidase (beta-lactamase class C family)
MYCLEIGSICKAFTSLLLRTVQRGEVALTDPEAKYLPAGVKMPERGGRQITLEDLSTHTSALPRLPTNLTPKIPQIRPRTILSTRFNVYTLVRAWFDQAAKIISASTTDLKSCHSLPATALL